MIIDQAVETTVLKAIFEASGKQVGSSVRVMDLRKFTSIDPVVVQQFRQADGSFTLCPTNQLTTSQGIVPYFANYAAIGLVSAFEGTNDPAYLGYARDWVSWYLTNLNPDGTIYDYWYDPAKDGCQMRRAVRPCSSPTTISDCHAYNRCRAPQLRLWRADPTR